MLGGKNWAHFFTRWLKASLKAEHPIPCISEALRQKWGLDPFSENSASVFLSILRKEFKNSFKHFKTLINKSFKDCKCFNCWNSSLSGSSWKCEESTIPNIEGPLVNYLTLLCSRVGSTRAHFTPLLHSRKQKKGIIHQAY